MKIADPYFEGELIGDVLDDGGIFPNLRSRSWRWEGSQSLSSRSFRWSRIESHRQFESKFHLFRSISIPQMRRRLPYCLESAQRSQEESSKIAIDSVHSAVLQDFNVFEVLGHRSARGSNRLLLRKREKNDSHLTGNRQFFACSSPSRSLP